MTETERARFPSSWRIRVRADALWLLLVLVIVTVTWCGHYHRWSRSSWSTPPVSISDERWIRWKSAFGGDALWGMAAAKAQADGEISFWAKNPRSLGAPFTANWNDWFSVEEGLSWIWALLARVFGLFVGSNLVLLLAHLLAGTSFFFVCRYLRYQAGLSAVAAALFALSHYAFWRGLPHLGLALYWHLPLGFVVLWWSLRGQQVFASRARLLFSLAVAVLFGGQSPYYMGIFAQFLVGASFYNLLRWRNLSRVAFPLLMLMTVVATFIFMNVDTLSYRALHGPNPTVTGRSYLDVELWALKPVELILPVTHSFHRLAEWADKVYFQKALVLGEGGSPYLGIVAIIALGWLLWSTASAIARNSARAVPLHFWCVLWALAYSVIGGLSGILGLWGILLFRASNRYSVVILCAALLFLTRELDRLTRNWSNLSSGLFCLTLLLVGIFDQVPPRDRNQEVAMREMFLADGKLVTTLERRLPEGAMIFELPVMLFPEEFAVDKMVDYEPLRPYLHSSNLRFSYGSDKGRYRERWQPEVVQLGAPNLVEELEDYGFAAILINRKGFASSTRSPQEILRSETDRSEVLAQSQDYICVALNPARHPALPPEFGEGWFPLEGASPRRNLRWSSGSAKLILRNATTQPTTVRLTFGIKTVGRRYLEITDPGQNLYEGVLNPESDAPQMDLPVTLAPGENEIVFATDRPGDVKANGDQRPLAFCITNFRVAR